MQPRVQLRHAPTSPGPDAGTDQGTDRLRSTTSASGISIREFFVIPDVYPESLLQTDEADPWISYADTTLSHEAPPDPWWHAIPAALSWVMNVLIEGFAAYGAAMEPGFFHRSRRCCRRKRGADRRLEDMDQIASGLAFGQQMAGKSGRTDNFRT
jgi:hypothetical protein